MRYIHEEEEYEFNDGIRFGANCGIIGLSPKNCHEENDWYVNEGYDGGVWQSRKWTKIQRKELADYMIKLWQEWSEQ